MNLIRDLTLASAALVVLAVAAAGTRVAIDSEAWYVEGRAWLVRGPSSSELDSAVAALTASVRCYVPFASRGRAALTMLAELGVELEAQGRRERARQVWRRGLETLDGLRLLHDPFAPEREHLRQLLASHPEEPEEAP